ncbi:helix-turn-helix domain-containing protein [Xylophilus sp. GW821-FHT01B05]
MNDSPLSSRKTHLDLAAELEQQRLQQKLARGALGDATGLSYQSLQKILEGQSDFRASNLLALAHALGLEVALVPANVGQALAAAPALPAEAAAPSAVTAALARLRPLGKSGGTR